MMELKAKRFADAIATMASMASIIRTVRNQRPEIDDPIMEDAEQLKTLRVHLRALKQSARVLGAPVSARAADRCMTNLKLGLRYTEVGQSLDHVNRTFRDEMETARIFALDSRNASYFALADEAFGADTIAAFPDARYDLEESGKCLATSRNTACVFHLMRALESVVQTLCQQLSITNIDRVWGHLISDINSAIDKMPKGSDKTRWAAASSYLWQVKEVWRNNTMHPKSIYTNDEAREVFEASRTFIRHTAKMCQP